MNSVTCIPFCKGKHWTLLPKGRARILQSLKKLYKQISSVHGSSKPSVLKLRRRTHSHNLWLLLVYFIVKCTAPQMIPRSEMIPKLDRKWSRTANDPRCGPQMIPPEKDKWHGVWFRGFFLKFCYFFIYLFIYLFSHLFSSTKWWTYQTNLTKRYSDNVNYNLNIKKISYFLLTILLKNYGSNSKLVDSNTISQQAWSTTIIA